MNNIDLLKKMGWDKKLIDAFESVSVDLENSLPHQESIACDSIQHSAISGGSFDLNDNPVATNSLFFASNTLEK